MSPRENCSPKEIAVLGRAVNLSHAHLLYDAKKLVGTDPLRQMSHLSKVMDAKKKRVITEEFHDLIMGVMGVQLPN